MEPTFFIVRHTAVKIAGGICYGQSDVDLSPTFSTELQAIKEKLTGHMFDHAFSSPLTRCWKLCEALHHNPIKDPRLLELNFGEWEGRSWDAVYASREGTMWFSDPWSTPCPAGEAYMDLLCRVQCFLESMQQRHGNILVVTHAGVVRAMLELLGGISRTKLFDIPIPYGQLVSISGQVVRFYE